MLLCGATLPQMSFGRTTRTRPRDTFQQALVAVFNCDYNPVLQPRRRTISTNGRRTTWENTSLPNRGSTRQHRRALCVRLSGLSDLLFGREPLHPGCGDYKAFTIRQNSEVNYCVLFIVGGLFCAQRNYSRSFQFLGIQD